MGENNQVSSRESCWIFPMSIHRIELTSLRVSCANPLNTPRQFSNPPAVRLDVQWTYTFYPVWTVIWKIIPTRRATNFCNNSIWALRLVLTSTLWESTDNLLEGLGSTSSWFSCRHGERMVLNVPHCTEAAHCGLTSAQALMSDSPLQGYARILPVTYSWSMAFFSYSGV